MKVMTPAEWARSLPVAPCPVPCRVNHQPSPRWRGVTDNTFYLAVCFDVVMGEWLYDRP